MSAPPRTRCGARCVHAPDPGTRGRASIDRDCVSASIVPQRVLQFYCREYSDRIRKFHAALPNSVSAPRIGNLWQYRDLQPIEARHAVRLGPERHATSFGKGRVLHAEQFPAVIPDGETVTFGVQAQAMP